MLVKGDKIRLVKPMGAFTNVGEICEVHNVEADGNIIFKFGGGMHKGYMSPDEFKKYFEKVEPVKKDLTFEAGDKIRMVKENNDLAPMNVGDEFTINSMNWGVVCLWSDNEKNTNEGFAISEDILYKHFEKIEEEIETNFEEGYDYIDAMISDSQINIAKVFDKCTIVACKLPNGFVIVESSSCVDPEDYDEDIGIEICLSRIKMRVAEMEAYVSHEEMMYGCDCECDCNCEDCCCEDDEDDEEDCTDSDLDCEDCPDKNYCDYYTNNN